MPYNPEIHHRRSIRLKGYDYSKEGLYFITLCTQNREHLFGEIKDGIMTMNESGKWAVKCWEEIPIHYPRAVIHEYIVMPNHIHGIIELTDEGAEYFQPEYFQPEYFQPEYFQPEYFQPEYFQPIKRVQDIEPERIEPQRDEPQRDERVQNIEPQHKFQNIIPGSIGSIIRGYKIGVTKWFRSQGDIYKTKTVWQRNYYESIIRSDVDFERISTYITNNPKNWKEDKFY